MYWLLNSAVIAVGGDGDYHYETVSKVQATAWLLLHRQEFVSRIGYPDNAAFIKRLCGVNVVLSREESRLLLGDEALVVRPAYRLQTGQAKASFRPNDDDFVFGILRRTT